MARSPQYHKPEQQRRSAAHLLRRRAAETRTETPAHRRPVAAARGGGGGHEEGPGPGPWKGPLLVVMPPRGLLPAPRRPLRGGHTRESNGALLA